MEPPAKRMRIEEPAAAKQDVSMTDRPEVLSEAAIKQQESLETLAELLLQMDDYSPAIPDAVTKYFLTRTGFECSDVRIVRLISLAAQKFVAEIVHNAMLKTIQKKDKAKEKKVVLTTEALELALEDVGIHVTKPPYYQ
eukprot:Colp12_sorted_trinity150504_noHs@2288